ncbi:MAG: hypothetical protein HYZ11_00505 [Candidatus Tectomicrobia bacterium]|uniref:Uncharacterized protein n=1 Tax=Tectimicrobiota bacterium TaxID=2528274 RepID=A0A932MKH0_UNCTE|nr:hypothetical protein [Candidatus Tectomicrobia bacterium]
MAMAILVLWFTMSQNPSLQQVPEAQCESLGQQFLQKARIHSQGAGAGYICLSPPAK